MDAPAQQLGRRNSFFKFSVLFVSSTYWMKHNEVEKAICFTLIQKHPHGDTQNKVCSTGWALCDPVKLTHKINHCSGFTLIGKIPSFTIPVPARSRKHQQIVTVPTACSFALPSLPWYKKNLPPVFPVGGEGIRREEPQTQNKELSQNIFPFGHILVAQWFSPIDVSQAERDYKVYS